MSDPDLPMTPDDEAIIAEEQALHDMVKLAVRDEALAVLPDMSGIQERVRELRDEAISASERDLPALFQQLYTQHSLAALKFEKKLPDMRAPYFAHMRLVEKGKSREVLIGYQTFIDPDAGITIIDWRHAVLAKVFFNYREGDEFEMELPGRTAQGTLAKRRVISFEVGELTGITGSKFSYTRTRGGTWRKVHEAGVPQLAGGAGKAVNVQQFGADAGGHRKLPDVSALLDQEQYEILNSEDQGALLILGGAGSGKTTIALHRLAMLSYRRPKFYQPSAMKVVVPEQGLVRLTQRLLSGLAVGNVGVETYDAWIADQGKHILKGLPKKLYEWTAPAVIYIKRHPVMFAVVDRYLTLLALRIAGRFSFLAAGDPVLDGLPEAFVDDTTPLYDRIAAFEKACAEKSTVASQKAMLATFWREAVAKTLDVETARSELYSNPELHAIMVAGGGGHITLKMTQELARHTRKQFEEVQKTQGRDDDDGDRGEEVDGIELLADDYAGTMDVEDYSVLLLLMLRVHGRLARKTKSVTQYKHLVIDEAQDLSPIEHRVLGTSIGQDATVTIAGDALQQSDPTVIFTNWDDVLGQLGVAAVEEARLNTNYRCPRPVAEFGHKVLGPMAPGALPPSVKDGLPVLFSTFPNEGLSIVAMTEALTALFERESRASVAVICEREENARRIFDGLKNVDDLRLVVDGEFIFKPGVDVTDVSQVKGLEFDYVIIPDASIADYPDTAVARRTMHIAITRAVHQLWVISVGRPCEFL